MVVEALRWEQGQTGPMNVRIEKNGPVTTVIVHRPEARNAVDGPTASALLHAFEEFERDSEARVAVLFGDGGTFCAGADLKAIGTERQNALTADGAGPMGPTRMRLSKPVIAAISGFAVAGGLELALWCDLRVAEDDSTLGVFCRRWGVPLIDGGTIRLPRLIGLSRALDLILTGRAVSAQEALDFGLVNRVVAKGTARAEAEKLAHELAALPQLCMLADRASASGAFEGELPELLLREFNGGLKALEKEGVSGAARFSAGAGRHGV